MPSPEKFNQTLKEFGINRAIIDEINSGFDDILTTKQKKEKAAYFKRAVDIMEKELPFETMRELMDANGCCKSGAREKASKAFAKENAALSVEERLPLIEKVPNMGKALMNPDGTITLHAVYYWDGEKYACACSNYNKVKRDYEVSKNYCLCCAGHFRYHYEIMLGVKLRAKEILSSPLDSEGKNPCVILFEIVKE